MRTPVLIADDDPMIVRLLTAHLTADGYEVRTVEDGLQALEVVRADTPEMLIADWQMPNMSGLELCRAVRADARFDRLYIILLTALTDKAKIVEGLEAGADDYVTKPFVRAELLARVRAGARVARMQTELARANAELRSEITERKQAEQQLRESEQRFKVLFENAGGAIFMADVATGCITECNQQAEQLTGRSRAEILGMHQSKLHPEGEEQQYKDRFADHVRRGRVADFEGELQHKDGSRIPILIAAQAVHMGGREYITGLFVDITERQRAEQAERQRRSLQDAIRAMEQVLGVVGHELRTPLAALRATSEFLLTEDAKETAEWDLFLTMIHDEAVRMAEMVNNLLEAARLNSGSARWNWSTVQLEKACNAALDVVRPLIDHANVQLTCEVNPPDLEMKGDSEAITRLIINLVSNSAKHTAQGSIDITVRALAEPDGRWIELAVRDTGRGIPKKLIGKLGRAFVLNSGVVGSDYVKGAGLGLAISKGIVAVHGGSMAIISSPEQGATFKVTMRADLSEPAQAEHDADITQEAA